MEIDPAASLNSLIEQARAAMAGADPAAGADEIVTGTAAEGLVRAEVTRAGRVHSIEADPQLLKRSLAEVCEHIAAAVNAALDEIADPGDVGPLMARLQEVQENSLVEMRRITEAFNAALAGASRRS